MINNLNIHYLIKLSIQIKMSDRFLIWSCNRRKFMKVISSEGRYKERLGSKLNSVWYISINVSRDSVESPLTMYDDRSYSTSWEFEIRREQGLDAVCLRVKLVSSTTIIVDKDIYFGGGTMGSESLRCNTRKLTGYNLDCILRFPQTDSTGNVFEEQTIISKLKYLADDFQAMFDKGHLTDVTLQCGNDVLQAHKFVLSARSPVFEAMFASPMQESRNDTVVEKDIDFCVFRAAISFLYSGQVKIASMTMAFDLLYVSEKYQIKELKGGCVDYLKSKLSQENAVKILEVSNLYDSSLKLDALNCVKENFDVLKNTQEWDDLKSKNSKLALEVCSAAE
ncbi:speckle-type POZ protein homolog [Parasteatoda tepidariorum]|uniref:speckle-type POZ protein homolog n=1 Tax=Parasteatoda tepidariorum TaxID=114398 RepID=UPI00077FBC7F